MKVRVLPWLALVAAICLPARGINLRERSESSSKQFVVFSTDIRLRQRVASYAEEVKADMLRLLGESDRWKMPIVITLDRASAADLKAPPARLLLADTPAGQKIEINVKIGDDPAAVNLQKYLVRALLLEYAYRGTPVKGGTEYVEAPWWIVEGLIEMERRREGGIDSDLFQRLVEANHLPPMESFLMENPEALGPTALEVDRALAMGLLQMLIDQPGGHENLARLVRAWPRSNGDPMAVLASEFPAVAKNRETLQKWWTVNLARFAAVDRYQALTVAETDKALAGLLQMELVASKSGEKKPFSVSDFPQFMKFSANRDALASRHTEIVALSSRTNALMRPIVTEYEEIFALLARGKTHGMKDRLAKVEAYRAVVLKRTSDIADYLNWWETTQMQSRSGEFDNYLKAANEISEEDRKQKDPIGRYLDELEREF